MYYGEWDNAGVRYVNDILDDEGNLYNFNDFKQNTAIETNFLTYHGLIHALPLEWKTEINNNRNKLVEIVPPLLGYIKALTKPTKWAYKNYLNQIYFKYKAIENGPHKQWEQIFGEPGIQWEDQFKNCFIVSKNTKLQTFQFKLLHRCTVTNTKLFYFGIKPSKACTFCGLYNETIEHLFYECLEVRSFWLALSQWYEENTTSNLLIMPESIILNEGETITEKNVILLAKYHIYRCRCKEVPLELNSFLRSLKREITVECNADERANQKWAHIIDKLD